MQYYSMHEILGNQGRQYKLCVSMSPPQSIPLHTAISKPFTYLITFQGETATLLEVVNPTLYLYKMVDCLVRYFW